MLTEEVKAYKKACACNGSDPKDYKSLRAYVTAKRLIDPTEAERSKTDVGDIEEQTKILMGALLWATNKSQERKQQL